MLNIIDLFNEEELKEKGDGNFQTICPDCGLQGGRTEGFILFPETNTAHCHSSHKWFTLLETAALKLKIIKCIEGNDKGEIPKHEKDFDDEVFEIIKEEYGKEFLTEFKISCGNIDEFLIKIYNDKGLLKQTKVNIDVVANYLKDKYNFKTIFGKKNDYVWNYNGKIYKQDGRGIIKTECEKLLKIYARRNVIEEIFDKIKRLTKTNIDDFDKTDVNLIPLRNGIWNIEKKELIEYESNYNFKFIIDINYNFDSKCPNWIKFVEETLYPDDIYIAQEWFGFNLFREYFIKKGIICEGKQDTGKSVFLDTLTKFVGEKNKTGISLQKITSGTDFTKLSLKNKHSNIYDDLSSKDLSDGGAFKIATGGGYISGEEKFGEFSQFRSFAKHLFATNKIPPVKDNDDLAYFGRWIILKFDNVPEKINPFLRKKLWTEEEMSGILNWALEGLYRLLDIGKFSYDKNPEETKYIMEESGCPLVLFSNDCLINKDGSIITKDEMYKFYTTWAFVTKKPRLSKRQLGSQLHKYCNYILADKHKDRIWKNVVINSKFFDLHKTTDTSDTSKKTMSNNRKREKRDNNMVYIKNKKASEVSKKKIPKIIQKLNVTKKSDREVQFYNAEECKNIKTICTKSDVLKWIKNHPKDDYKKVHKIFGIGFYKFINQLRKEGKIK